MNQDLALRSMATQNLARHSQISRYLGEQLRRRLDASCDWLVNSILYDLVTSGQLHTELLLQHLVRQVPNAQNLLESIFADVKCDDEGYTFDERLADALVELHLLRHLQENGYGDIVRPSKHGRTPDFTASRDSSVYHAEAKRLKDNDGWILSLALRYLQAVRRRYPELGGSMIVSRSPLYIDKLLSGDVPRADKGKRGQAIRQRLREELGPEGAHATLSGISTCDPSRLLLGDDYVNVSNTPPGDLAVDGALAFTSSDTLALENITLLSRILGATSGALQQSAELARQEGVSPHYLVFVALGSTLPWGSSLSSISISLTAPQTEYWRNLVTAISRAIGSLSNDDPYGPKIRCALVLQSFFGEQTFLSFGPVEEYR